VRVHVSSDVEGAGIVKLQQINAAVRGAKAAGAAEIAVALLVRPPGGSMPGRC
jgi:hypothetical protein